MVPDALQARSRASHIVRECTTSFVQRPVAARRAAQPLSLLRAAAPSSGDASPALELLLSSQRAAVLDAADRQLAELCSSMSTPEEQAECWEVYKFYSDRRAEAQAGCAHELAADGHEGAACASLNSLERLVYEVEYAGAEQLYRALLVQSNIAKRAASGAPPPPRPAQPSQPASVCSADTLCARANELFALMDADGDGVIDREELLAAMHLLHRELDETETALALECMDTHGRITREQFVCIVATENACEPECDAAMLRHAHAARPGWWTDAPHCVTDV